MMIRRRKPVALLLLALCVHACSGHATRAQTAPPPAVKFDEFGDVPASDIAARLDNFANVLMEQPHAKGFVIAYRSQRDLPGLSGRLMNLMRTYLITTRGIEPDRVAGVDGGAAGCVVQQLWIVPPGAAPAPLAGAYQSDYEDVESTRKFDEAPVEAPHTYHNVIGDSLEGYANALRKEPRATGYLIVYAQYWVSHWQEHDERGRERTRRQVELDPPGRAARVLRSLRAELARKHGIPPSRIRLMDGGYRKWAEAELWIVPRGGHAPIATPNAFPKRRR